MLNPRAGFTASLARSLLVLVALAVLPPPAPDALAQPPAPVGWQAMAVIHQEGNPQRFMAADLDGDRRDEIVVVNTRQSRLDVYRWNEPGKRPAPPPRDSDRPNELPLAPQWSHSEIALESLPLDVLALDIEGDRKLDLVILSSPPSRVLVYKADGEGKWKKERSYDLLPAPLAGREKLLLSRRVKAGAGGERVELLISTEQGIQTLALEADKNASSRPVWLAPREQRGRAFWKLIDLDGDGDDDLIEWSTQAKQTARWFENVEGKLQPAQVLHEDAVQGMEAMAGPAPGSPADVLLLGGSQEGLLRRFNIARGDESPLGNRQALPLAGANRAAWCGIMLDGKPALVSVDPAQPRLRVEWLGDRGWTSGEPFPIVAGVRAIASPQGMAQAGVLLLWVKDAPELHISMWRDGRMTFPRPDSRYRYATTLSATAPAESSLGPSSSGMAGPTADAVPPARAPESQDRRILALDTVGDTTWWAQRVGEDVDLYVWPRERMQASRTRFVAVGAKVDRVVWAGGQRILVQDAYSTAAKLAVTADGKTTLTEPAHLAKVELAEFHLITTAAGPRLARLTEGVLQWLDDDLQPADQVMLPENQRLVSFVPVVGAEARPAGAATRPGVAEAWVLEQGGQFAHRMKTMIDGVMRPIESVRLPGGGALQSDPVLGLMLVDQERVIRLSKGRPWELKLIDSIDSRVGRPSGVKEATIHRVLTTDAAATGQWDVMVSDDRRHQLTWLTRGEKGLTPVMSWQVFEDRAYPYGAQGAGMPGVVSEPRALIALNADGDGRRDLAMLCQDRLLIYLAKGDKP